jgi:hypothetical protein
VPCGMLTLINPVERVYCLLGIDCSY